jgi:hypothetical protein
MSYYNAVIGVEVDDNFKFVFEKIIMKDGTEYQVKDYHKI